MRAYAHDIAKHVLQCCVCGLDGQRGPTWALDLQTGDRLAPDLVDVILYRECVGLDHLFAVFRIGVNIDLQRSKLAVFQSNKGNVFLRSVSKRGGN